MRCPYFKTYYVEVDHQVIRIEVTSIISFPGSYFDGFKNYEEFTRKLHIKFNRFTTNLYKKGVLKNEK